VERLRASGAAELYAAWLVHLEVLGFKAGSIRAYRSAVSDFIHFLDAGEIRYDAVSHTQLDKWKLGLLRDRELVAATVNYYVSAVKAFYDWLEREGYVFNSPVLRMKGVKTTRLLPKPISEGDVSKIIEAAGTVQLRAMLEVFYGCGIRCEELRTMDVGDVDLGAGEIRILAKGGKWRVLNVAGYALEAVRVHLAGVKDPKRALWLGPRGKRITQKMIRKQLREAADEAGVMGNIHPHRLRHSFATHLLNHGMGVEGVQKLMGHRKIDTTMIYTEVAVERVRAQYLEVHPRARVAPDASSASTGTPPSSGPDVAPGGQP
jgi:site-specific recombinase XerD